MNVKQRRKLEKPYYNNGVHFCTIWYDVAPYLFPLDMEASMTEGPYTTAYGFLHHPKNNHLSRVLNGMQNTIYMYLFCSLYWIWNQITSHFQVKMSLFWDSTVFLEEVEIDNSTILWFLATDSKISCDNKDVCGCDQFCHH